MGKLTKVIAAASAAAVFTASAPVMAAEELIEEFDFDFQPHVVQSGPPLRMWSIDHDGVEYGSSANASEYNVGTPYDTEIGPGSEFNGQNIDNMVLRAWLSGLGTTDENGNKVTHRGSRFVNLLFGDELQITPELYLTEGVAKIEFDWKATITGAGDTMDTYFIGPGGVKYFGVRASYHSNSKAEPWSSTIDFIDGGPRRERPLYDESAVDPNRPQEWYSALLPDNQWYRISVTLDFETHRIIEVTYRKYASAEEPYFATTPVVTLKDLPFVDEYDVDEVSSVGIGAVRLESVRNAGNIEAMDWNVDNFKAYNVTGKYHKVTLTLKDGETPVEGAAVTLKGDDFESGYTTDSDGKIQTKLAPGTYEYSVSKPGYPDMNDSVAIDAEDVDKTIDYNALSYTPEPKTVEISGGQSSLTAPHTEANVSFTSAPFAVKVIDQEGVERTDYSVKWAISPADDEHVSIDEDTGAVTVTKGFDGGRTGIRKFTITPTVTIGDKSNSGASAEIEISDFLFYDSGKGGSSYGDPETPPRAHQIGEDGVYTTTSAGGDWVSNENHVNDGREYKGIINIPEPIEFAPGTVYEMSFDTTSTAEVYTFGRSLILSGEKEEQIPGEDDTGGAGDTDEGGNAGDSGVSETDAGEADDTGETGETGDGGETGGETRVVDTDFLTIDYIRDGIGKRYIEDPENPQWKSDDNTFETEYGTLEDYNVWKHASIVFTTNADGVTTAVIMTAPNSDGTGGYTTELGEIDAKTLSRIKLTIEICRTKTDRFAALRNVIIREVKPIEFEVGEQYAGQEARLILAEYNDDGTLADVETRGVTLNGANVVDGIYTVDTAGIARGTKAMLWIKDKYIPVAPAQTVR